MLNDLVEAVLISKTINQSDCDSKLLVVIATDLYFCNSAQVSFSVATLCAICVVNNWNVIVDYQVDISKINTPHNWVCCY